MKRITLLVLITVLLAAAFFLSYKDNEVPRWNCKAASGIVSDISARDGDVVFELEGNQKMYHIDGGLDFGFDVKALEKELLADEVTILYADPWHIARLFGDKSKHIREIRNGNWIVYSEF